MRFKVVGFSEKYLSDVEIYCYYKKIVKNQLSYIKKILFLYCLLRNCEQKM